MEQFPIEAVFENGLFRPLNPVHVPVRDGEHVRLRIEEASSATSLDQACRVYEGLSASEIADVEQIALSRDRFFGSRSSN